MTGYVSRVPDRAIAETAPLVVFRGAKIGYAEAAVLERVDLELRPGDLVAVAGPNGSGKTTLFRTLLGFLPLLSGGVERNCALSECGYVPQSATLDAAFPITAREVVEMGGYGRLKPFRSPPTSEKQRLTEVLDQVGLGHLAGRLFFSLSGGQRQRMLIARALMVGPKVLVLDEPLAGCDPDSQRKIGELLVDLSGRERKAIIFSSHDLRMVRSVTRNVFRVDGGRLERQEGAEPDHPW